MTVICSTYKDRPDFPKGIYIVKLLVGVYSSITVCFSMLYRGSHKNLLISNIHMDRCRLVND